MATTGVLRRPRCHEVASPRLCLLLIPGGKAGRTSDAARSRHQPRERTLHCSCGAPSHFSTDASFCTGSQVEQLSVRFEIAVYAPVVDANDEQAGSFYRHHGFTPFGTS